MNNRYRFHFIVLCICFFFSDFLYTQEDSLLIRNDSLYLKVDSTGLATDSLEPKSIASKIFDVELDSLSVNYFIGSTNNLKLNNLNYIDTSTFYLQQYDPIFHRNAMFSTLSNIGMSHSNFVYTPTLSIDYYFTQQSFPKYLYQNQEVKYYQLYIPYTELSYYLGSKREQSFQVKFSRELLKRLTIGIDYSLNNSPGIYANNQVDDNRIFITGQYYTANKRYGVIANYLYNRNIVQENGGIKFDSIFEDNLESDRRVIPVELNNAQNTVKETGFFVEQYFNLLKPKSDSSTRKLDAGSITLSLHYQRNQMVYTDNDSVGSFYQPLKPALSPAFTYDSISQMRLKSKFQWSSIGYHDSPLSQVFHIYFGLSHEYIYQSYPDYIELNSFLYDNLEDEQFNQIKPYGGIGLNIKQSFRLNGYAEIVIGNYNSGDLRLKGDIEQYFGTVKRNFGKLLAGVEFVNRTPSWYFQKYQSNVYRWQNSFKKENYLLIFGEYQYQKLKGGIRFYTLGNHTYFDDSIRPAQLEDAATLLQTFVEGIYMIRKFGLNTRLVYQQTSQSDIIAVPKFTGVFDIFFKSQIFKNAATLQTGFELRYFTKFNANAYMPALRDWHNQQSEEIGNYLFVDVYLSLKVKTARMFLKYANLNGLFGNYNYYLAPGYPDRDPRFYFGISWRFHN